ncbi:MAG TPA: PilC/PilY family type IV pilus protein [Myxococcota bacterium]|nr:PilC/PilY family type IV pilus protein [Myxococcota bacterium]
MTLAVTLAFARDVRAQAGDLDILSRTVPPDVMLMLDSSGSMSNLILPPQYVIDRIAGGKSYPTSMNWFNKSSASTTTSVLDPNFPASYIAPTTTWYCGSSSGCSAVKLNTASVEDYRPTCQLFNSTSATTANSSVCTPVPTPGSSTCKVGSNTIGDDDQDQNDPLGGTATIRCWNVPGGCANVPAGLTCSTASRARKKTSTTSTTQPYTIITFPNVSFTPNTDVPPNYMWWMMQQIYKGNTSIQLYMGQDRNGGAKQALTNLVNAINIDGQTPRVKFGLARYQSSGNGGYVLIPPDLNNKTALLAAIASVPASGGTPLSETLVDIGRYFAGADKLGDYPQYSYSTSGATVSASAAPQSPVTSSCEKLFVVLMTDGLPTSDCNNHYGTDFNDTFHPYNTDTPAQVSACSDFLDDVAAGLYAIDLRKTLSGNQNLITYTVGFTVDSPLLQNAATRGNGQYFQTNNADELSTALISAIQDIIAKNTTLSSATVPSTRTAYGNGFYTAYFVPTGRKSVWPGKLEAYTMSPDLVVLDDNNNPALDPVTDLFKEPRHPFWEFGATLLQDYASRTVYTTKAGQRISYSAANLYDPTAASPKLDTNDFALTTADMGLYPQPATSPTVTDPNNPTSLKTLGQSIINWTLGFDAFDEDGDGSTTNARPFVFGDVFHSSPVAIGPPTQFLAFEKGYGPPSDPNSFIVKYGHRDRVLYVGANDGMLHGVNAGSFVDPNANVSGDEYYTPGTGHERFAYVPGFLLNKIKSLPRNDIAKTYYVDGPPSAADAWIDYNANGVKDASDWTTTLITPMRQGGEGLLALDVTDPSAASGNHGPYPRLMWEFTNADLGQTWSRPIITRVKMKGPLNSGDHCGANDGDGDCVEQWVAVFGSGYEDYANPNMGVFISDPNNASYKKGRGIFIVRISDGAVLAHVAPVQTDATLKQMQYAIAAEPAVLDLNNDGFADVVYVGDTGGQMWKWDIHSVGVPTAGLVPTTVWPIGIMFQAPVATVAAGVKHYHSIFQGVAAAFLNSQLWISFASGERADLGYVGTAAADPNAIQGLYDDNNRMWVLRDLTPYGAGAFPTTLPVQEAPAAAGHQSLTDITLTGRDSDPNDAGYFFRVPNGMKFITDQLILSGVTGTLAYMPDVAGSGDSNDCALGGTTFEYAWTMANGVGVLTGSGSSTAPGMSNGSLAQAIGNGAPTNPRITISVDQNGAVNVGPMVQTSTGEVRGLQGFPNDLDPVDMIFWRQDF